MRWDPGIEVRPLPITLGEHISIHYNGLLAQSGADQVYLHLGYGYADEWTDVQTLSMDRDPDGGFSTQLQVGTSHRLLFCFKDSAGNWDNNSGRNWSYGVHGGDK